MRPMSIRAPGSAGSAGAGEPPSCATADSEGGEAGLEVVGEVAGPSTDASPLPPPAAVSAAAAAPKNDGVHHELGLSWHRKNEPGQAMNAFQQAAQLNPGHAGTWHNLGQCHQQLGQADEARGQWEKSLGLLRKQEAKMTSPDSYLLEQLGNVLNKLGQADKANAAWQRSYDITPNQPLHKKLHPAEMEE